ncbi:hypothetical protein K701_00625 [Streptomyces fradiae ATCC 10745 = DSM 40063]|uniref:Uncharacterized protein n=1 Tax=Streptomyces fradiae ATCC 10745 = DSM 40063 TaxID=1319510 RepID=A0ABQ6Y1M4_STRFR|nr:hypothetical protein K701_00625 [Streptomyces fradiae ATCC 10745 = DSM 40063]
MRQAQPDGGGGAVAVGRFDDGHPPARPDEGGARVQQLAEGAVEGARPGEASDEFVEGRQIGDPPRQPVLERGSGLRRRGGDTREGRRSVSRRRDRGIDSGHFRQVRGAHGSRLSGCFPSLNSIANPHVNPHVMLRRYQCIHMYTYT